MVHKKKSRAKRRLTGISCVVLSIFVGFFALFELKARDLVYNSVDNELEIIAQSAMDDAVLEVLSEYATDCDDIVTSKSTDGNEITSLSIDSKKVNTLKAKLSKAISKNVSSGKRVTVAVPAGAFTGLVLLSSLGPELPVMLRMDGSCTTTIESEFTSAGINQTVHHIYLYVEADVSLGCPIIDYEETIISKYELCQTVIVGGTPNMLASMKY